MRKVLVIMGNPMELGQTLTTLFGMNPKFKIIYQFVGLGIRPIENKGIITAGQQQFEPITTIYLVYTNEGKDIEGLGISQVDTGVKAQLKN